MRTVSHLDHTIGERAHSRVFPAVKVLSEGDFLASRLVKPDEARLGDMAREFPL